ncbi:MAG: hypothetical protein QF663_10265 [Verrucomicrobiota bacterium]|nr:hypothetical protein [Verrucomicrobiota bacterium]
MIARSLITAGLAFVFELPPLDWVLAHPTKARAIDSPIAWYIFIFTR